MKTFCKKIIIRDRDLEDLIYKSLRKNLFDRIDYEPLTYKGIQEENLLLLLLNQSVPGHRTLPSLYEDMLFREKNLYNRAYLNWELTMDYPNGQIWVRSRSDRPREPLVVATFEKDYE